MALHQLSLQGVRAIEENRESCILIVKFFKLDVYEKKYFIFNVYADWTKFFISTRNV